MSVIQITIAFRYSVKRLVHYLLIIFGIAFYCEYCFGIAKALARGTVRYQWKCVHTPESQSLRAKTVFEE